jgi:DNA-binding NarL/FixJ family response regulator
MLAAQLAETQSEIATHDVREQLERMLASHAFQRSSRLSRFLNFVVEQSLRGEDWKLKEYSIAVEVFRKPEDFDPRLDSAVRVAARQLRAKLDKYYSTDGRTDPVLIRFRPGDYIPRISRREVASKYQQAEIPRVIIVDGDRRGAHSLAECLDPAACSVAAVTNDTTRAMAVLTHITRAVVIAGCSVCGGLTGCELLRALHHRNDVATVAVLSSTATGSLISEVVACEPAAFVFKPLRPKDVETAVRVAGIRMNRIQIRRPEIQPPAADALT